MYYVCNNAKGLLSQKIFEFGRSGIIISLNNWLEFVIVAYLQEVKYLNNIDYPPRDIVKKK